MQSNKSMREPLLPSAQQTHVELLPVSQPNTEEKKVENNQKKLKLEDVVRAAPNLGKNAKERIDKMVEAFNSEMKETSFTETINPFRGERLKPTQVWLATRNNIPELRAYHPNNNKVAVVINFNPNTDIVDLGIKEVLTELYIGIPDAKNHILNVPVGYYLKAYINNKEPVLYGEGTHIVSDSTFTLANPQDPKSNLVAINQDYISHGSIHIIRVPQGSLGKAWWGAKPTFLEAQEEPYVYNDWLFRLDEFSAANNKFKWASATNKTLKHGSLTRIMVDQGEVAIGYDAGKRVILKFEDGNGKPILKDSAFFTVHEKFLPITLQTLEFPNKAMQEQLKAQGNKHWMFESFNSKEGFAVGVKLVITYCIDHPEKALARFNTPEEILNHIEKRTIIDMGAIMSQCSYTDFQNRAQAEAEQKRSENVAWQGKAQRMLADDLVEYGIKVEQISIEHYEMLNPIAAQKLSEQALQIVDTNIKVQALESAKRLAESEAQRDAARAEIAQKQRNDNAVAVAKMETEVAEQKAKAQLILAEGEKNAALVTASIYRDSPHLFQLQMADKLGNALKGTHLTLMVAPSQLQNALTSPNALGLFQLPAPAQQAPLVVDPAPKKAEQKL